MRSEYPPPSLYHRPCHLCRVLQLPHQPGVPRVPLVIEDRVCNALEALMGEMDFWGQGPGWAARLGELLDRLRVSEGRGAEGRAPGGARGPKGGGRRCLR